MRYKRTSVLSVLFVMFTFESYAKNQKWPGTTVFMVAAFLVFVFYCIALALFEGTWGRPSVPHADVFGVFGRGVWVAFMFLTAIFCLCLGVFRLGRQRKKYRAHLHDLPLNTIIRGYFTQSHPPVMRTDLLRVLRQRCLDWTSRLTIDESSVPPSVLVP